MAVWSHCQHPTETALFVPTHAVSARSDPKISFHLLTRIISHLHLPFVTVCVTRNHHFSSTTDNIVQHHFIKSGIYTPPLPSSSSKVIQTQPVYHGIACCLHQKMGGWNPLETVKRVANANTNILVACMGQWESISFTMKMSVVQSRVGAMEWKLSKFTYHL